MPSQRIVLENKWLNMKRQHGVNQLLWGNYQLPDARFQRSIFSRKPLISMSNGTTAS